jgi:heparosan-N-sulfate-glucuronate 5-epimerase
MKDRYSKFKGYLSEKNFSSYWQAFNPKDKIDRLALLSPYPLDIRPRLSDGHYTTFDSKGLPMVHGENGQLIYHITTLCGYGLAKHQIFLSTGAENDLETFKCCVKKIISLMDRQFENCYIQQEGDKRHGSFASAMIVGEILSLVTRMYQLDNDDDYLRIGEGLLHYFATSLLKGGVRCRFSKINAFWYEEYAFEPVKHVLNGMNYALIGLYDMAEIGNSKIAKMHFDEGITWLEKALPDFDLGWWSYYFVQERDGANYIASAMYHNLHIEQLRYLGSITQSEVIINYQMKFESYSKSMESRLYAGYRLFRFKLMKK